MSQILYTDAGQGTGLTISWRGVADSAGVLLDADLLDGTDIELAELEAVLLACDYIADEEGVILTDSLTAAKMMGNPDGLFKLSQHRERYLAVHDAIARKLPVGWRVAWIPGRLNLAHKPLQRRIREGARL